jgi:hypothetical protein
MPGGTPSTCKRKLSAEMLARPEALKRAPAGFAGHPIGGCGRIDGVVVVAVRRTSGDVDHVSDTVVVAVALDERVVVGRAGAVRKLDRLRAVQAARAFMLAWRADHEHAAVEVAAEFNGRACVRVGRLDVGRLRPCMEALLEDLGRASTGVVIDGLVAVHACGRAFFSLGADDDGIAIDAHLVADAFTGIRVRGLQLGSLVH